MADFQSMMLPYQMPPFRYWAQKILPAVYDDSLSYYELLDRVVQKLNETIAALNKYGEDTAGAVEAIEEIRDNLEFYILKAINEDPDTKDAIDNAIRMYMQTPYPTFNDMIAATHVDGEVCITRGYNTPGDGGDGLYIVSSDYKSGLYGESHNGKIFSSITKDVKLSEWGVLPGFDIVDRFDEIISNANPSERNNVKMDSLVLIFGSGIYYVSRPLAKIPPGSVIKGTNLPAPYMRKEYYYTAESRMFDFTGGTTISFTSKQDNATCMRTSNYCRVEGIFFLNEGSYQWENISHLEGETVGYKQHPENVTRYEPLIERIYYSVNALDMGTNLSGGKGVDCYVSNCAFVGFGGFGLRPSAHALVSHCVFNNCHIGMVGMDAEMVDNCFFGNGGYGIVSPNVRLSNCWFDSMVHHAIYSGNNTISGSPASSGYTETPTAIAGEISGCVFDHIQYSAIKARSCGYHGLVVNASFSRCGFYRAGLSVEAAIAELNDCDTIQRVEEVIDGMCAINIPIANNLKLKGSIASIDFVDGNHDGKFNCPQFALHAEEFCNGHLEFAPYNAYSKTVYQMESNYWWTETGFQDDKMPNVTLRYKFGTIETDKSRYPSNHREGSFEDAVTGLTLTIQNDVISMLKSGITLAQGDYTMTTIPGYNEKVFVLPVTSTLLGHAGWITFPQGRNPVPVLHLSRALNNETICVNGSFPTNAQTPKEM